MQEADSFDEDDDFGDVDEHEDYQPMEKDTQNLQQTTQNNYIESEPASSHYV